MIQIKNGGAKMEANANNIFSDADVIFSYTREDAIADGMLYDVTETAKKNGFKIPVAVTVGVHELCANYPDGMGQSYDGRLIDTLLLARLAIIKENSKKEPSEIMPFEVAYVTIAGRVATALLWVVFNPHEGLTIMRPDEY